MRCCNAYESASMAGVMGETLRPGGFSLTEKAVRYCGLTADDTVLDLGCGRGATVNYLYSNHHIRAVGIDPSAKLIEDAKKAFAYADFYFGRGENLQFEDGSFRCVFAECTLSLMDNLQGTLAQVCRVLGNGGWFAVTDVYARKPKAVGALHDFTFNSCMRGLHDLEKLKAMLLETGFRIELCEDCSELLRELLVKAVFSYGSMDAFWNVSTDGCMDGCGFQEAIKRCRPGYFILIARKEATENG